MKSLILIIIVFISLASLVANISCQVCLAETNTARRNNGKTALTYNAKLAAAAKGHNDRMVASNCFSHQCSGETGLGQRLTAAGYRWSGVAENLAAGSSNCKGSVTQWLNSPGHKVNLLGNYKHVGCSMASCSSCTYKTYWTCVYANPLF